MSRRGFTLMEALMTVTVLAVLASIALPNYQKTITIARMRAARDVLLTIFTGEQTRLGLDGGYITDIPLGIGGSWDRIFLDDPNINAPPGYVFQVNAACPCVNVGRSDCQHGPPAGACDPQASPPITPSLFAVVYVNGSLALSVDQTGTVTCLIAPCP